VAGPLVQRPKKKGGLGIKNLLVQNDSLLIKQLHKFYSKDDIPWVQQLWFKYYDGKVPHLQREMGSFWWKDIFRLKDIYGDITSCASGDGTSILFWKDNWTGKCLIESLSTLALFAKNQDLSVNEVSEASCLDDLFHIPISHEAALELNKLRESLQEFNFEERNGQRIFFWGNGKDAASKVYKMAFSHVLVPSRFSFIWK
jgi:hypothetical protein